MLYHDDMFHIEETAEASKKQVLMQEDIDEILAWTGTERDAMKTLNITRDQYRYVKGHYDANGRLDYRRNLNTISYD